MRLEALIETLRTHRSSADECARQLAARGAELAPDEAARGFRTALAVGALDQPFGRRLAAALEKLAGAPDAAAGELPELRALEEELAGLADSQEGVRADLDAARLLRDEIDRHTRELADLTAQAAAAAAAGEAARRRGDAKQALLTEVGDGRNR